MHIRNHSRPSMVLLSLLTFFSAQVFAVEFAELSACRLHYQTVVQPGATDIAAMDTWCLGTAKMDPLNVCADKKLYAFMTTNSITSDQKSKYREDYRQACYREQQSPQVATNTTPTTSTSSIPAGAVISATAGVTYNEPTATGAPKQPVLNLQTCTDVNRNACEAANQSATAQFAAAQTAYNTNLATYNAQVKSATDLTTQERQQVQQATQNMVLQAGMQAAGAFGSGNSSSNSNPNGGSSNSVNNLQIGGTNSTTSGQTATGAGASGNATGVAGEPGSNGTLTAAEEAQLRSRIAAGCAKARAEGTVPADLQADCNNQTPTETAAVDPVAGEHTESGAAAAQQLAQAIQTANTQVGSLAVPDVSNAFTLFNTKYRLIANGKYEEFKPQKEKCVQNAQRANKFCLEGQSPGVKFAKGLIDYSGPVIALVRSAHKACSDTARITDIAQGALVLAKGVCVAMKLTCDSSCATTRTRVEQINKDLADLRSALTVDLRNACPSAAAGVLPAACTADAARKRTTAEGIITSLTAAFQAEVGIEPGRTGAMIASCHNKTKDILLMGANILTLAAARGSAEKCEAQTAANGTGTTGDTTTAEYCSVASNASTQFCKCQATPNAEGCGALGTNTPDALAASNQIGANLQSGSGLSSFAGGNSGGAAGSGSDFGIGSENGATSGITADLNGKSAMGAGPGAATGASVGGGGGGGAAGGDPAAAAAGAKEDKKSIMSTLAGFANSLSGAFGGGNKGGMGNGSLSSQQQAAIQRKIASDKVSGEVTGSSGLDNFSKIKKSYGQKADTLMQAP